MKENAKKPNLIVGKLPAFEGAGIEVARKFVQNNDIRDTVAWERAKEYDILAEHLVDLHAVLEHALNGNEHSQRVKHLVHGVYPQHNEHPLDGDAVEHLPVTITREESRIVAFHALDALKNRFGLAITGQPGIGKTRGSIIVMQPSL